MNQLPQTLLDQLHHADHNERRAAVATISSMDHPAKLALLIDALQTEPDPFIREDLTYALTRIGHASVPALIALLHDERAEVRDQAAHVLGKIGHADAVDPLIAALDDAAPAVIAKAAFALHQIGAVGAIPALVARLDHADQAVQTMLIDVLTHFGSAAVPALAQAAAHDHWEVRERAIEILGNIGDPAALPALTNVLSDADWRIRFAAVNALGQIDGATASDALRAMLKDADARVHKLAERLLLVR